MKPDTYDDMIHLPHPVSKRHKPMSMWQRAAQFAPFAALTGFDDAIAEAEKESVINSFDYCDDLDEGSQWRE